MYTLEDMSDKIEGVTLMGNTHIANPQKLLKVLNELAAEKEKPVQAVEQGWEKEFDKLPDDAHCENGINKFYAKTFIRDLLGKERELGKQEGRDDLAKEILLAAEITKAQGYEHFGERVAQLVKGLQKLESNPT